MSAEFCQAFSTAQIVTFTCVAWRRIEALGVVPGTGLRTGGGWVRGRMYTGIIVTCDAVENGRSMKPRTHHRRACLQIDAAQALCARGRGTPDTAICVSMSH